MLAEMAQYFWMVNCTRTETTSILQYLFLENLIRFVHILYNLTAVKNMSLNWYMKQNRMEFLN